MIKIKDITFYEEFFEDYNCVPDKVKVRFESRIEVMSDRIAEKNWSEVLGSFNAHKIAGTEVWIGHLTNGGLAWRVLFEVDKSNVLHFWRILTHNEMDKFIRNIGYS